MFSVVLSVPFVLLVSRLCRNDVSIRRFALSWLICGQFSFSVGAIQKATVAADRQYAVDSWRTVDTVVDARASAVQLVSLFV